MSKDNLQLLKKIKNKLKNNEVVQKMFKDYDVNISELDLIPVMFRNDLEVSARTDHAIIYINSKFLDNPNEIEHYLAHEVTHFLQQTTGTKPTQGSNDSESYIENPYEQEAFKNQTEYLSDTKGDEVAEKYINKVLDHHDITSKKEREKRKNELLQLAQKI